MSSGGDNQRKALGKGLSALIPARGGAPPRPASAESSHSGPLQVPIDAIEPNPLQPRTVMQEDRLEELAQSIRANGIIQPLIVRRRGDHYQLIAGERRWRASRLAGLASVPVVVQELADDHLLEVALIENIQREDLNPLEIAHAFDRLVREHHLSHEEIGRRTGKDRTTVTNMLRLLKLPEDVQRLVAENKLSMGHARAILGLATPELQRETAERAARDALSVRQVEQMVQRLSQPEAANKRNLPPPPVLDPNVRAAIAELEAVLSTRVRIVESAAGRGKIEIEYYSPEDLDRLYTLLTGKA